MSIKAFTGTYAKELTYENTRQFVQDKPTEMLWLLGDVTFWANKVQPKSLRKLCNMQPVAKTFDKVGDVLNGPYQLLSDVVALAGRALGYTTGIEGEYTVAHDGLSAVKSATNTLSYLHQIRAVNITRSIQGINAAGHASGVIDATLGLYEEVSHFPPMNEVENEEQRSLDIAKSMLEIAKKVSLLAVNAMSLAGIAFGVAASSTVMMAFSSLALVTTIALHYMPRNRLEEALRQSKVSMGL